MADNPNQKRDAEGRTLLSRAVARGDAAAVRQLLLRGANPNLPDKDGMTVLNAAVHQNRLEIVKLLIGAGANVNASPKREDSLTMPPLLLAAMSSNTAIVEALLKGRANINATDSATQGTALHYSCNGTSTAMVRLLLLKGARVDARDLFGKTPLMYAAMQGNPAQVKLLIDKGANVYAREDRLRRQYGRATSPRREDGLSVLDWANYSKNAKVIALIRERMKKQ